MDDDLLEICDTCCEDKISWWKIAFLIWLFS
jgi:hypothetical protein